MENEEERLVVFVLDLLGGQLLVVTKLDRQLTSPSTTASVAETKIDP